MKIKPNPSESFFEIPYYHDYISPLWARYLINQSVPVTAVPGLSQVGAGGGLETESSLRFLVDLYVRIKDDLGNVLRWRMTDRKFIDERVRACFAFNERLNIDFLDPRYKTILGLEDAEGRIVVGPKNRGYCAKGGKTIAPIPDYLKGPHVTLFGPPDSAKMAINAMNAYHRKLKGEPKVVEELLATQQASPKWGADDEDSKPPLRQDLIDAAVNLTGCFDGTLTFREQSKTYELARTHRSAPMKRFPGLALPSTFLFYQGNPIPLHLYDFALHVFQNWHNPESLAFYVPKLENEEEARYIHKMISTAESMIKELHPEYVLGTIRVMIVLENPRAILRTHEIMDELHPYFVGASLGWHDYLASTARLFKEDGNYRIPVKADPNIVIKYIKASHSLLADVVGSRGGIKVGGMYGILPQSADLTSDSFQVALKGFFKDVITQLKRDLTGFWVAHPDFVRLGLAIIEAWHRFVKGDQLPLFTLTREIFNDTNRKDVDAFIRGDDIAGLDSDDPNYVRALLVADIKESDYIANNHPDEIRYNVFQSLQYLTDWLCGNGCVALPTIVDGVPVRVMDDLATAERSRWEVWHELRHGRFALEDFLKIAHEEMRFIRKDLSNNKKIVQVKWDERTAKWYPVAFKIMIQLMTAKTPVEFATELLMPFTVEEIRKTDDPWSAATAIDAKKFANDPYVDRWNYYFERCGVVRFANDLARNGVLNIHQAEALTASFSVAEIIEAATFHGDIGESAKTLDHLARGEQRLVTEGQDANKAELRSLGAQYLNQFGFKFLVSAQGKKPEELLAILKERLLNSRDFEINNAKNALWQITLKRIKEQPLDQVITKISELVKAHKISGAQIALANSHGRQSLCFGEAIKGQNPVRINTLFEIASLSKTIASAFAIEFFKGRGISLSDSVNVLFAAAGSKFRLKSPDDSSWADKVTLAHLMNHSALNMHYVKGFPTDRKMPRVSDILNQGNAFGYDAIAVISKPGSKFKYSGGGFLVLEHLIEIISKKSIFELTDPFLRNLGLDHLTFRQDSLPGQEYADGYFDSGLVVTGGRLLFPAFAAGGMGSASEMLQFLQHLGNAFIDLKGSGGISHDTAVTMLHGRDFGCRDFMNCDMGLGVFVTEAGDNRLAIHQGSNEGFRAIYVYAFAGPDQGKGFVILCNADNRGVLFISEVAQTLLRALKFSGVDFSKFSSSFDFSKLSQEQIVNLGYKSLVFSAFEPTLPERIKRSGVLDPLAEFNILTNSRILSVSNQRFARAENLISAAEPVFDPELFGAQGKIMDSWESVRHNPLLCDVLDLELKSPSHIQFIKLSTKFHDGNQAQFVRILGRTSATSDWAEILPKTSMNGHSFRKIRLDNPTAMVQDVRIEMYPDGGLTRVGLYKSLPQNSQSSFMPVEVSACERFNDAIPQSHKPLTIPYRPTDGEIKENTLRCKGRSIDFACAAFGGKLVRATNEHYGPAIQVISPFPPIHMFDGLESARSRIAGHYEEVVLKLGREINLGRIVFDFKFFTNNNPNLIQVFAFSNDDWVDVSGLVSVKPFAANQKELLVTRKLQTDQLMVRTYPDGGINRIHVYEKN